MSADKRDYVHCLYAGTLQIYNETLTEVVCSADVPVFHLIREEILYDSYDQLPGLFDIEAITSGRNVATLYINGTNRSDNVTVICGNADVSSGLGQIKLKILFTLMLEFISKFINQA